LRSKILCVFVSPELLYLISCWYFSDQAVYFLDLIKIGDKSALWCSDNGCGESFVDLVKEYSSRARRFIVEDEKLRTLIKSKLVSRWLLVIFLCLCMHDHSLFIYC
jgi:hypothetical protein